MRNREIVILRYVRDRRGERGMTASPILTKKSPSRAWMTWVKSHVTEPSEWFARGCLWHREINPSETAVIIRKCFNPDDVWVMDIEHRSTREWDLSGSNNRSYSHETDDDEAQGLPCHSLTYTIAHVVIPTSIILYTSINTEDSSIDCICILRWSKNAFENVVISWAKAMVWSYYYCP